jgi:hypothetical protein
MRHTCAIYLLRSGVDLVNISHWLDHADANTTKLTREIPRLCRGRSKCLTFPAVAPPGTYRRNFEREPPSTQSEPDRWTTHGRAYPASHP